MSSLVSGSSFNRQSQAFDRLAKPVQRWVWTQEWRTFHGIQELAIASVLNDQRDVIIAAPTAGGKTEAAFLPLISVVLENPGSHGFDLVYLSPLKALINDQFGRLRDLCSKTDLPVHPWHGDISQATKTRARENPRGILLITPESLEALFVLRGTAVPRLFRDTRAIVVDEMHAFLNNERGIHARSLLSRIELSVGRRIRRVGLSASLGDMDLARQYLRPEAADDVRVLEDNRSGPELRVQLRGYVQPHDEQDSDAAKRRVAKDLFAHLRGNQNLIFAGSRQNVEWYADALREMSDRRRLSLEFLPHHSNLSRQHREEVEERLRSRAATTAVCTSTLELGVDIGAMKCVAQIGPPHSIASLRQRLGRSGRRADRPAVLRMYQIEEERRSAIARLHLRLVQSIAMVELLIERWCEPPPPQALHLSTLTHQILSVIAEHTGASARTIFDTLCRHGPFGRVGPSLFSRLLRQLGTPGVALIEQARDGRLLLGSRGERLVNHYTFYAVFETPSEYRIVGDGKGLGRLPITALRAPGSYLTFSGRRWRVVAVRDEKKVIEVTADQSGRPPPFRGPWGPVHDIVAEKMREVLCGHHVPAYLDDMASQLMEEARSEYRRLGLERRSVCSLGPRHTLIATGTGTVRTETLALALRAKGYEVDTECGPGFIEVRTHTRVPPVVSVLESIARLESVSSEDVVPDQATLRFEKYHRYLCRDLLLLDAASSRLELRALPGLARRLIATASQPAAPPLPPPDGGVDGG